MEITEIIGAGGKYGILGLVVLILLSIMYLVIKKFLEIFGNFINTIGDAQNKVVGSLTELSQNSIKKTEILLGISGKLENLATEQQASQNHEETKKLLHALAEQIKQVIYNIEK